MKNLNLILQFFLFYQIFLIILGMNSGEGPSGSRQQQGEGSSSQNPQHISAPQINNQFNDLANRIEPLLNTVGHLNDHNIIIIEHLKGQTNVPEVNLAMRNKNFTEKYNYLRSSFQYFFNEYTKINEKISETTQQLTQSRLKRNKQRQNNIEKTLQLIIKDLTSICVSIQSAYQNELQTGTIPSHQNTGSNPIIRPQITHDIPILPNTLLPYRQVQQQIEQQRSSNFAPILLPISLRPFYQTLQHPQQNNPQQYMTPYVYPYPQMTFPLQPQHQQPNVIEETRPLQEGQSSRGAPRESNVRSRRVRGRHGGGTSHSSGHQGEGSGGQ